MGITWFYKLNPTTFNIKKKNEIEIIYIIDTYYRVHNTELNNT